MERGAPAVPELAGFPAGEGLSLRRLEVGRQFAVECCRDDPVSPGAGVDAVFIAQSREALADVVFDADLEDVCTWHDMTRQPAQPARVRYRVRMAAPGRPAPETAAVVPADAAAGGCPFHGDR